MTNNFTIDGVINEAVIAMYQPYIIQPSEVKHWISLSFVNAQSATVQCQVATPKLISLLAPEKSSRSRQCTGAAPLRWGRLQERGIFKQTHDASLIFMILLLFNRLVVCCSNGAQGGRSDSWWWWWRRREHVAVTAVALRPSGDSHQGLVRPSAELCWRWTVRWPYEGGYRALSV